MRRECRSRRFAPKPQNWIYGDRSVARKLLSGDKIALIVLGDSRLNLYQHYFGGLSALGVPNMPHVPLAGSNLNPFYLDGVTGAPWSATSLNATQWQPRASDVLAGTYIGDYAPYHVGEVLMQNGTAPATDGDGGGTIHNTSSALQFNHWQFQTWEVRDRPPSNTPGFRTAFAAEPDDVQMGAILYTTPTGVTTADLHLQFRADAANYTEAGPYYAKSSGVVSYSATAGYARKLLATPSDWVTYPYPSVELIYTRGAATRAGETVTLPLLWVERATYGVTVYNFSLGGRALVVDMTYPNIFPGSSLFEQIVPLFAGTPMLWLDLGTNDTTTKAVHKGYIADMISAFRAGTPNGLVMMTNAYPTASNTPGVRPPYAQAAVEVAEEIPGVLCLDTHLRMGTYAEHTTYYQDTIHYGGVGGSIYVQTIDQLLYQASG